MSPKSITLCLFLFASLAVKATEIPCKKEAEAYALADTKKKGNMPNHLFNAHPSELEDGAIVVYIGARAGYNYYKLRFDDKCKFSSLVEVEYVPAKK